MPQLDQLSACPGCGEPREDDDRFCGVCGTDLRAAARGEQETGRRGPDREPGDEGRPAAEPAIRTPTEPDFPLPPPQPPAAAPAGEAAPPRPASGADEAPAGPRPGATPLLPVLDPRTTAAGSPAARGGTAAAAEPTPAPAREGGATPARPDPRTVPHDRVPAAPGAVARAGRRPGARSGASPEAPTVPLPVRDDSPAPCASCGNGRLGTDGYCEECGRKGPRERDHVERALREVAAVSDLGLRHHRNEDAFSVAAATLPDGSPAVIAVVCDGVSSSSRPDEASATAAAAARESLLDSLPRGVAAQQAMHDALLAAAAAVAALADESDRVPGRNAPACTIVSAVAVGGTLTVGWIGDSRAYWVPEEEGAAAARLTEDDSWAAQMVAAGLLTEAEAMQDHRAHAITAWLGADAQEIDPHTASFKPDRPGVVIVCTDGLWNYAETAEQMAELVPGGARRNPLPSARRLVRYALDSGGHDNVTVAVIPFPAAAARAGTA